MWLEWLPWRWMIGRIAKVGGFMDPGSVIAQLQRFAQPSEVTYPVEILRLAAAMHARGLINSQAIQHNLDWVWPYWAERQFDPKDPAFIPRAFSLTHINLTHRNWTAVGLPGCDQFPIVDPAGLVTPLLDGWSIDCWIVPELGKPLIPSRLSLSAQALSTAENLSVTTQTEKDGLGLTCKVEAGGDSVFPVCLLDVAAVSNCHAWCVISLRPYNPEGISFINHIEVKKNGEEWRVNERDLVRFHKTPERFALSEYCLGDVYRNLFTETTQNKVSCHVGLATGAGLYELWPGVAREIRVEVPLTGDSKPASAKGTMVSSPAPAELWTRSLLGACRAEIPDLKIKYLYDSALRTVLLHAPKDVYPGPYTYKHFWFRDAAFILYAMICAGLQDQAEKVIDASFFHRQTPFGYFHSQDGEWDSNGEALWTLWKYCQLTGREPKQAWRGPIEKAAKWIERKRLPVHPESFHSGLLPAGFSAEHLGPSDYYYWDDFWSVAGLKAAAKLLDQFGEFMLRDRFENSAADLSACIDQSLMRLEMLRADKSMPASPNRRMDSGAIGSIVSGYPLRLWQPDDPRLAASVNYLLDHCFIDNGFFHDMGHSGINPYLTLHIAQNLLRAGDSRYFGVMKGVADIASPTGQWPEAVNPVTQGGCMGDGQHVWAAAEWLLMIRNCFVREENDTLLLCSGISPYWLEESSRLFFGPVLTEFGSVSVWVTAEDKHVRIAWSGNWHKNAPKIEIRLPFSAAVHPEADGKEVVIESWVRS